MGVQIKSLRQSQVEHGKAAVRTPLPAADLLGVGGVDPAHGLVYFSHQGFVLFKDGLIVEHE
jgi:hypothetical protein